MDTKTRKCVQTGSAKFLLPYRGFNRQEFKEMGTPRNFQRLAEYAIRQVETRATHETLTHLFKT
jgi:hypothetical protein